MNKFLKMGVLTLFFALCALSFAFFEPPYENAVFAKDSSAKAMAVVEKSTGRLLYSDNENERLPMASTTKIITAIYVIEHVDDLDQTYEIPRQATKIEGTSIGLKEGEHLTIRELLYGLMLRSGNDSAVALAIYTSGSEEQYVADVNAYLAAKGFKNTHLANPHGLPNKEHYTTAHDLALITAYALKNPTFSEIVATKKKQIANELGSKYSRSLVNKNKLLSSYEFADGVKTGYTRAAGRCFVGSATKDGMQVVCVLLNDGPMFEDCQKLLDKAFKEFKLYKLIAEGDQLKTIKVSGAEQKEIALKIPCDFFYPLKRSELELVKMRVEAPESVKAPVSQGQELASLDIMLEKQLIFSTKIFNIEDIESNRFEARLNKIIEKM